MIWGIGDANTGCQRGQGEGGSGATEDSFGLDILCVGLVEHDSLCSMGSVFGMRFCAEAIIDEHIAIAAQQKPCHVGFG